MKNKHMKIDLKKLFGLDDSFDEKSINALLNAINKNHLKKFDYLKFKASIENLVEMNMDEETSIKSTFTTAKTIGITKDYLLDTIKHYKNVLQKEKENFSVALKNKLDSSIVNKKKEGEDLKKEIANLENKIKEYQKAIEQGKERLANIESDISKVKTKIESAKNNFVSVLNHLETIINEDESKIKSVL